MIDENVKKDPDKILEEFGKQIHGKNNMFISGSGDIKPLAAVTADGKYMIYNGSLYIRFGEEK